MHIVKHYSIVIGYWKSDRNPKSLVCWIENREKSSKTHNMDLEQYYMYENEGYEVVHGGSARSA